MIWNEQLFINKYHDFFAIWNIWQSWQISLILWPLSYIIKCIPRWGSAVRERGLLLMGHTQIKTTDGDNLWCTIQFTSTKSKHKICNLSIFDCLACSLIIWHLFLDLLCEKDKELQSLSPVPLNFSFSSLNSPLPSNNIYL